jgi:hypothetical protein
MFLPNRIRHILGCLPFQGLIDLYPIGSEQEVNSSLTSSSISFTNRTSGSTLFMQNREYSSIMNILLFYLKNTIAATAHTFERSKHE